MPSSPFLYFSGLGVIGTISLLALSAMFLTLLISPILLWLYRRTIARLMSVHVGRPDHHIASDTQFESVQSCTPRNSDSVKRDPISFTSENNLADGLYRLTITESRHHACKYAIAGVLLALLMAGSGFLAYSQVQINNLRAAAHPFQFLFIFWTLVWPIVLTINIVAVTSRLNKWLIVMGYFVILVVLGGVVTLIPTEESLQLGNVSIRAWAGETPIRLVNKWSLYNFTPTLLIIVFRIRRIRAVAPLVLSFMTVVSLGVLGIITAAFLYQETSIAIVSVTSELLRVKENTMFIGYFLLLSVVACLLFGVLGWQLLVWMRSSYLRKTVSDQSLAVDALWVVFVSCYALILAFAGPGWALSALMGFVVYKSAVNVGNRWLLTKHDNHHHDSALLILRVFALGKRSEILFDAVTRQWRHIGNVQLIAGTDLALSTVAPHQFLAFVSGKLNHLFISSKVAIERGLAEIDTGRDNDGRFRINNFFCHADTWQSVLTRLVKSIDVVLMDLRSFSKSNAGCVFEIKELLDTVPLRRLIFVVDDTTDKEFLKETLKEICLELRSDSPNLGVSASAVRTFELKSSRHSEIQGLIRKLCDSV